MQRHICALGDYCIHASCDGNPERDSSARASFVSPSCQFPLSASVPLPAPPQPPGALHHTFSSAFISPTPDPSQAAPSMLPQPLVPHQTTVMTSIPQPLAQQGHLGLLSSIPQYPPSTKEAPPPYSACVPGGFPSEKLSPFSFSSQPPHGAPGDTRIAAGPAHTPGHPATQPPPVGTGPWPFTPVTQTQTVGPASMVSGEWQYMHASPPGAIPTGVAVPSQMAPGCVCLSACLC